MKDRSRIAFISTTHGHSWPGSEFLWAKAAEVLLDGGHPVFARFSMDFMGSKPITYLKEKGMIADPYSQPRGRLGRFVRRYLDPLGRLSAWRPDLIVISAGSAFDVSYQPALARLLMSTSVPFVLVCHFNAETFWVDGSNRQTMREIYKRCAAAVFVSADNLRITERQLAMGINNANISVPPFPLRLDAPLPWPEEQNDTWNFACVARLESRWKGQDVLFEALSQKQWSNRQWHLNLYGEGDERSYLEDLALHYGIADRVTFHGFVCDRTDIWRNNHIQIFPTRGEGGPMVLTEGMMCGRTVVITHCGNVREYVQDGVDGFISGFATPEIFSNAMERAWKKRGEWRSMGIEAHKKIANICSIDPTDELLGVLDKVLSSRIK